MPYVTLACRLATGIVFVVAVIGKVRSRSAFREFVGTVHEMTSLAPPWNTAASAGVILVEASVVALMTAGQAAPFGFSLAGAVLLGFSSAIARAVRAGSRAPCRCFGSARAPLGARHLLRNAGLFGMAIVGLICELTSPAGGTTLAGDAIALACAGVAALLVILFDDLADLLTAPSRNY